MGMAEIMKLLAEAKAGKMAAETTAMQKASDAAELAAEEQKRRISSEAMQKNMKTYGGPSTFKNLEVGLPKTTGLGIGKIGSY
jgi:hypothetical protein